MSLATQGKSRGLGRGESLTAWQRAWARNLLRAPVKANHRHLVTGGRGTSNFTHFLPPTLCLRDACNSWECLSLGWKEGGGRGVALPSSSYSGTPGPPRVSCTCTGQSHTQFIPDGKCTLRQLSHSCWPKAPTCARVLATAVGGGPQLLSLLPLILACKAAPHPPETPSSPAHCPRHLPALQAPWCISAAWLFPMAAQPLEAARF